MTASAHDLRLTDTTLRDGSHAIAHSFTERQVRDVTRALDTAGVPVIEVSHGDGLAGSSYNYGFSAIDDLKLIAAAAEEATRARIAVLLLPGVGTAHDLRQARAAGASVARIATHCTEADVSIQHFEAARTLDMEAVGFLMLAHRIGPEQLAEQAAIMTEAGCQCVYVVDSAGAMLPSDVTDRVGEVTAAIGDRAGVGFHGHQNLSLGVANSLAAHQAGASHIDGTLCALGAGAGNTPTEVLVTALDRAGVTTGVEAHAVMDAAEEVLAPILRRRPVANRPSIVQGRYGVYSSFLLHAERAALRYAVPAHEILRRVGEAGYVGGQEDMIIDIALQLVAEAAEREAAT